MDNDMQLRLGDIAQVIMGQSPQSQYFNSNGQGKPFLQGNRTFGSKFPTYDTFTTAITKLGHKNSVVMSVRAPVGELNVLSEDTCLGRGVCALNLVDPSIDPDFLFYALKGNSERLKAKQSGTVFGSINKSDIESLILELPDKAEWNAIAKFLGDIDRKILVNEQINKNLLDLIDTVFKQKILKNPSMTTWKQKSLLDIATFQNGLPMQKFRPHENEEHPLKVIKIKELSNKGFSETSELCSATIDKRQIVNDGDLLFSWSGTLLADFWTGGSGGLNQHLYKVTPKNYPIWFIYCWLKYHLREFQSIAKAKATTMGHIKRSDLENAAVYIPPVEELESLNKLLNPIQRNLIVNRITSRTLSKTRDELLPQLLSGEIEIQ